MKPFQAITTVYSYYLPELRELILELATFERLRETATRVLGTRTWPALVCYRIRYGVK